MESAKNNQLLKVELSYDQDYGQIGFNDFIEDNGLERLSDWEWLKFGNPDSPHFTPTDVYEALEEEARRITASFEQYAYDTPYQFRVELIDCQSGDTIDEDSLGGIYADADLTYLKEELETAIKNLNGIDGEVMALAFDTIRPLDYTDIKL